jgi:hypothetical protein
MPSPSTKKMGKSKYDTLSLPDRPVDKIMAAVSAKAKAKAKSRMGKEPMDYMKPRNAAEQKIVDKYNAEIERIRKANTK